MCRSQGRAVAATPRSERDFPVYSNTGIFIPSGVLHDELLRMRSLPFHEAFPNFSRAFHTLLYPVNLPSTTDVENGGMYIYSTPVEDSPRIVVGQSETLLLLHV